MSAYSDRVIADGATNYWRLNETSGTSAVDVVGGKTGTISGGVTLNQAGAIADGDKAMGFNGTTGQIVTAQPAAGSAAVSMEAWIKRAPLDGFQTIVSNRDGNTGPTFAGLNGAGQLTCHVGGASGDGATPLSLGSWFHAVWVHSGVGQVVRLYLNGVFDGQGAIVAAAAFGAGRIGIGVDSTTGAMLFSGAIDDVAIYPRALTPAEIAAHYTLGTTADGGGRRPLSFGYYKKVWSAA